MNDRVIALIAAYNEAPQIGAVVAETAPHVRQVVVIDDGSLDDTSNVAQRAGAHVIRHPQNRGKGGAILTGLEYFRQTDAEYAILLDADGQHDPAEIPAFVARADETGAGLVVGTRMQETKEMPRVRLWTNQLTSRVCSRLARQRVPDSQCGYRLLRRTVLPDLKFSTSRFETETEMLIQAGRAGHKIESVPIRTIYKAGRVSRIHPVQDAVRFFKLVKKYWS